MQNYLDLLGAVLDGGTRKEDRTGTGTRSRFGAQLRFDLRNGFPAVTTKRLAFKTMAHELLWFLRGETNIQSLVESNVHIWDEWADANGDLGPVYGKQWRSWGTPEGGSVDQIAQVVQQIKDNPNSRRHVVSAWNVADLDAMNLPPCHILFQFYVAEGRLSCGLYQRSADLFLGVPFNIASYALLTHLVAQVVGLQVGDFVHSFGDVHIYENHIKQVHQQLKRAPGAPPHLQLDPSVTSLDAFTVDHITLRDYLHQGSIKAPVAV